MKAMTIFDDIRKDAEAGTPGPWDLRLFQSGTVQVVMREWDDGNPNPMSGGSTYGYHSAYITMYNIGQRDENDTDSEKYHNARRIARVPNLEKIVLAAKDVADAIEASATWAEIDAALDAFHKATEADE